MSSPTQTIPTVNVRDVKTSLSETTRTTAISIVHDGSSGAASFVELSNTIIESTKVIFIKTVNDATEVTTRHTFTLVPNVETWTFYTWLDEISTFSTETATVTWGSKTSDELLLLVPTKPPDTVTVTTGIADPTSSSTSASSSEKPNAGAHKLALETALPICLVALLIIFALIWNRQRRRNRERFAGDATFQAPSHSQREDLQRWWKNFTATGRQSQIRSPQAPGEVAEMAHESKEGGKHPKDAPLSPQQPGEVAEIDDKIETAAAPPKYSPSSPLQPGELAELAERVKESEKSGKAEPRSSQQPGEVAEVASPGVAAAELA